MGDEDGIRWYAPDPRCIIDLDEFHASRRLLRKYRQGTYELKVNSNWHAVVKECANRDSTWITADIFAAYARLHEMGLAHCVEAWLCNELVGGLYGVSLGGAFMGESMFHRATDASKVCLVHLVERLRQRGYILLDCQFMTGHLQTFGAKLIPKNDYLRRLQDALALKCRFVD